MDEFELLQVRRLMDQFSAMAETFRKVGDHLAKVCAEFGEFGDKVLFPLAAEEAALNFETDEWLRREVGLQTDLLRLNDPD